MNIKPSLEECIKIADSGKYGVIPVWCEILSDSTTPIEVLKKLKNVSKHVYLLESAEADKKWGRYSFLGYDPLMEITAYNGEVTVTDPDGVRTENRDI